MVRVILFALVCWLGTISAQGEQRTHLFILSGQSNMVGLDANASFTPTVKNMLRGDEIIVVKDAQGGQPIRRWYRDWKPDPLGALPDGNGDLYRRLMNKVEAAAKDKKIDSVTFVWMQGERDANTGFGDVYELSLNGLIKQLRTDLKRPDMNVVIGRLSDFNVAKNGASWRTVREAQVAVAEADPRAAWVDTDDLNGRTNGLHYSKPGYQKLGERFATAAVKLIATPQR